jgi:hypothetical protein
MCFRLGFRILSDRGVRPRVTRVAGGAVMVLVLAALVGACGRSSPTAPTVVIPSGDYRSQLFAMKGVGTGGVSVTTKPIPQATFDGDFSVRVQAAQPNTTYLFQRAAEIGRALGADGICQRAAGVSPWSPNDPPFNGGTFTTFVVGTTTYAVITNTAGDGTLDFEFKNPNVVAGTVFDVMFRLVDNAEAPTLELRSSCFTVTVK